MPTVLYPIHIAFFELIIDPACSTVYEGEHSEDGIMKRKPRGLTDPLFGRANIFISLLQGLILLSVIMVAFYISLRNGDTEWTARSVAFITMVLCNLSLIYADLSQDSVFVRPRIHKNKPLYLITAFVLSSILLITKVPFLMGIFHFSPLSVFNMKLVISLVLFCYASLEALKLVGGNRVLNR
jgi:Ca2+-transporting ATPase